MVAALECLVPLADAAAESDDDRAHLARSARVIRTMLNTAAITAPPDLWLLRHVLGTAKNSSAGFVLVPSDGAGAEIEVTMEHSTLAALMAAKTTLSRELEAGSISTEAPTAVASFLACFDHAGLQG